MWLAHALKVLGQDMLWPPCIGGHYIKRANPSRAAGPHHCPGRPRAVGDQGPSLSLSALVSPAPVLLQQWGLAVNQATVTGSALYFPTVPRLVLELGFPLLLRVFLLSCAGHLALPSPPPTPSLTTFLDQLSGSQGGSCHCGLLSAPWHSSLAPLPQNLCSVTLGALEPNLFHSKAMPAHKKAGQPGV